MGPSIPYQLGKALIVIGIVSITVGVLLVAGAKFSFFGPDSGWGRLPGDITYKSKNFQFYFPVATSIVISILLTLVLWVIAHFTRR